MKHSCFIFLGFVSLFILFSCASASKKKSSEEDLSVEGESVSIPIPERKSASYFSSIDSTSLSLAEDGSPSSLKQMAMAIHKIKEEDYEENEIVLLQISSVIMNMVWTSDKISWDVPYTSVVNPYTGALDSARQGLYDSSTGSSDFFTLVLPSLVLFSGTSRTDYYEDAEEALTAANSLKEDSTLVNYLLGVLYYRERKYEDAKTFLEKSSKLSLNNRDINMALSEVYYALGEYDASFKISKEILSTEPHNIWALKMCSESCAAIGNYAQAEDYVLKVLQVEPDNMDFVLLRAKILMSKGDYIKAASLLDVYARTGLISKDYLLLRSQLQKNWNRNVSLAAETAGRALTRYPEDREVLLYAATLASDSNQLVAGQSALELITKYLEMDSDNVDAMLIAVSEMNKAGNSEEAYEISSKLAEVTEDANILSVHVEVCLVLNKVDEAWQIASSLYEIAPEDEKVRQLYVQVLVATGRSSEASRTIASMLEDADSRMKSFLYYQKSLLDTDSESIMNDLRSSLTANPRNRDSLFRLYRIYYSRKDWRRAQYYLKQVVALNPSDVEVLALNAELDTLLGK